jgi:hypothetical protein
MLRWKEPASFKRALARQHGATPNPWYPLPFLLGIVAVCLVGAAFHNKPAMGSWPLTVALATGAGFLVAYGVPFLASRDPNLVVISERGVGRRVMRGVGFLMECWPWERVAYCSLESTTLEGRSYSVLVVHSESEDLALFALGPNVDVQTLEAAIAVNGRRLRVGERHLADPGAAADRGRM